MNWSNSEKKTPTKRRPVSQQVWYDKINILSCWENLGAEDRPIFTDKSKGFYAKSNLSYLNPYWYAVLLNYLLLKYPVLKQIFHNESFTRNKGIQYIRKWNQAFLSDANQVKCVLQIHKWREQSNSLNFKKQIV